MSRRSHAQRFEDGRLKVLLITAIARDFDDIRAAVQQMHNDRLTYAGERLRALNEAVPESAGRKAQAAWIIENVRNDSTGLVFGLLDGKDIEEGIWKLVLESIKSDAQPAVSLSND